MDVEIAAVITVSQKLELLDKLLERRIMRSALDVTSPALPLLNKVYKLGEYRRLAANLKVMNHRIECALTGEQIRLIADAAMRKFGLGFGNRQVRTALKKAQKALGAVGVELTTLNSCKDLPLYAAECRKLKKISEGVKKSGRADGKSICCDGECACCRDGRTAQA